MKPRIPVFWYFGAYLISVSPLYCFPESNDECAFDLRRCRHRRSISVSTTRSSAPISFTSSGIDHLLLSFRSQGALGSKQKNRPDQIHCVIWSGRASITYRPLLAALTNWIHSSANTVSCHGFHRVVLARFSPNSHTLPHPYMEYFPFISRNAFWGD